MKTALMPFGLHARMGDLLKRRSLHDIVFPSEFSEQSRSFFVQTGV
jgi:hypothetical protein